MSDDLEQLTDQELEVRDMLESEQAGKVHIYALGREHERADCVREIRRYMATTGNRKVLDIIARMEGRKHVTTK